MANIKIGHTFDKIRYFYKLNHWFKCKWLYLIYLETQSKVLLAWGLGSRIVIC